MNAKTQRRDTTEKAEEKTKNIGLRGVTVADTKISDVDGENGILIYRGYRIEDLAKNSAFEETAYLLLHDDLPTDEQLKDFKQRLAKARQVPTFILNALKTWPHGANPMDALQASVPLLAMADPELEVETREANVAKATRLISRIPGVVAAWQRIRHDQEPIPADERLSHAENFLWQLTGKKPDAEIAMDLDIALILHADHSFNASTFACREVVSTQAHMYAAVAAGVGALSGSLHGGANAEVMKMLQDVQNEKDLAEWVRSQLGSGKKIMGMGHAVYKTNDPRAQFLKEMGGRLGRKLGQEQWHRMLREIEAAALAEFEKR